jgi:hypothetical protein
VHKPMTPRAGGGGPQGRTPSTTTHRTCSAGAQRPGGCLMVPSLSFRDLMAQDHTIRTTIAQFL